MKSLAWGPPQPNTEQPPSILFEYDTIYTDLDGCIWNCYFNGTQNGAYLMTPPLTRTGLSEVTDVKGNICTVQDGVLDLLPKLAKENINLGIISLSYNDRWTFAAQPAVMLLKIFDIYRYFRYSVVIKPRITKAEYIKPKGRTLYIDDDNMQIDAVLASGIPDLDVLRRTSFQSWSDFIPATTPTRPTQL